jgi:SAM-dependent methyltransferase
MDDARVDPAELERSLGFIRRVNRWLGYTRATIGHLDRFARRWNTPQTIRIVDFATGAGDVPQAILRWADQREHRVEIVGLDLHPVTARLASRIADGRFSVVRGDALNAPFADGAFDYAIGSMFLHHLDDASAVRVLREMDRVARRGIIAADLLRNRRAYAWISLFTLAASPMVRHDARASVLGAFDVRESRALIDAAGLSYARWHRHFGHRFVIAGEKGSS